MDFLSLIERGINAPSFENLDAFSVQLKMPLSVLFDFDATQILRYANGFGASVDALS